MGNKRLLPQRIRTKDSIWFSATFRNVFFLNKNMIKSALYSGILNIEHSIWIKVLEPADLFMFKKKYRTIS